MLSPNKSFSKRSLANSLGCCTHLVLGVATNTSVVVAGVGGDGGSMLGESGALGDRVGRRVGGLVWLLGVKVVGRWVGRKIVGRVLGICEGEPVLGRMVLVNGANE